MPAKKSKSKPKDQSVVATQVIINPPIPKPGPDATEPLAETVNKIFERRGRNGA